MSALLTLFSVPIVYFAIGFVLGYLGKREIVKEANWQNATLWRKLYWSALFPLSSSIHLWSRDPQIFVDWESASKDGCSLSLEKEDHISTSMMLWPIYHIVAGCLVFFYIIAATTVRLEKILPDSWQQIVIITLTWCNKILRMCVIFVTNHIHSLERKIEESAKQ